MNALAGLLEQPAVHRLGWTLVHFAWQGAALALLAMILLIALRQRSANARYGLALALLLVMACCPAVTFVILGQLSETVDLAASANVPSSDLAFPGELPAGDGSQIAMADMAAPLGELPGDRENSSRVDSSIASAAAPATSHVAAEPRSQPHASLPGWLAPIARRLEPYVPWIVLAWSVGVTALSLQLLFCCRHVGRLKRQAHQPPPTAERLVRQLCGRMGIRQTLRLLESALVHVPATIGWIRPVILMPAGVLTGFSAAQLEAILAHELAHIRRHDYAVNLAQCWIETLLFYHPAVWWLSRRIRAEREHACDDLAVATCGDRMVYAHALVEIAERGRCNQRLAVAAAGGDLQRRVRRLLALPQAPSRSSPTWIAGAVLLLIVCGAFLAFAAANDMSTDPLANEAAAAIDAAVADEKNADEQGTNEKTAADAPPKHTDPKMVEIIKHVRENERRYRDLETIVRRTTQVADAKNPKKWSPTTIDELLHTVQQNDLIYFRGEETRTDITGNTTHVERVSAFDGEKTRSVDYGNSVNIHLDRHESPYVYPPHNWALVRLKINFPLSVFLEGTEAIRKHPKVHRYPQERGSVYEFPRVETSLVGEEVVDGLACTKIRCQWWYYSNDPPATCFLWLAPDRNYLCVKSESVDHQGKERVTQSSKVEKLREIAPGVWLPSKVTGASFDYEALRNGKQVADWNDSLVLKKATSRPGRSIDFFRDLKLPTDLPAYTIKNGRLTGSHFQDRDPPPDSAQKLAEVVVAIRQNERHYDSLEIELDKTYSKFDSGIRGQSDSFIEHLGSTTRQHSLLQQGQAWYTEQQGVSLADGSSSGSQQIQAYDGSWARGLITHNRTKGDATSSSVQATLHKGGITTVHVHRPQMFFFHDNGHYDRLSDYMTSGWQNRVNNYRLQVSYLGDEVRDGLRCDIVRFQTITGDQPKATGSFRLVWLARDRNYLPIRYESHAPGWCVGLPTSVGVAKDLRELRPGVWCPFRVEVIVHQKWEITDLSVGRVIINHRTDYTIRKATLEPKVAPGQFAGPAVPKGTKVYVQKEAGRTLGQYEQPADGPLSIADNAYLEMLNAANVEEGKRKERLAALDALMGKPAPEIPKTDWINGPPRTWKDFAGKVVVVDFSAHWCGPCTPDLKRLSELHGLWQDASKSDVVIVGVHTAGSKRDDIDAAVKTHKLGYPICIDAPPETADGWGTLYSQFAVRAIPETFVIDKDGKVAAHGRLEEMLAKASQLAKEQPDAGKQPRVDKQPHAKQPQPDESRKAVEQPPAIEPNQSTKKPHDDALPEGVLIRGQVLDDETGKPIDVFRVLAGSKSRAGRDDNGPPPAVWQPHLIREFKAGSFDWPAKRSYDDMRLRIEADGYQPAATDWIRKDEKPRTIAIRLKRDPGIAGRVLRPDGQPAAGAILAIALPNRAVRLEGKSIAGADKPLPEKPSDRWRIPQFVKADADGRFRLPTETETCALLCAVHEAGYLQLAVSQLSTAELGPAGGPRELKLAAWGRIEGTVIWKDRPGVGEPIRMSLFREFPGGAYPGAISSSASAETDAEGRFHFDDVPPGQVQISRLVKLPDGKLSQYQLPIAHVNVKPGEPTPVLLGGQGVTVTGRLKGLGAYAGVTVRIAPNAPHIGFPGDDEQWKGFGALMASPVGPLYFRGNIPVAKDGSFRIENVLPAYYQLFLDSADRRVTGYTSFHVDSTNDTTDDKPKSDDKPQDIGEIQASRKPPEKPKPGNKPVAANKPMADVDVNKDKGRQ